MEACERGCQWLEHCSRKTVVEARAGGMRCVLAGGGWPSVGGLCAGLRLDEPGEGGSGLGGGRGRPGVDGFSDTACWVAAGAAELRIAALTRAESCPHHVGWAACGRGTTRGTLAKKAALTRRVKRRREIPKLVTVPEAQ